MTNQSSPLDYPLLKLSYSLKDAVLDVQMEIWEAIDKHGYNDCPVSPEVTAEKAFIILAEEFGEVARALQAPGLSDSGSATRDEGDLDNLEDELIQTAAMSIAMLIGVRERRANPSEGL